MIKYYHYHCLPCAQELPEIILPKNQRESKPSLPNEYETIIWNMKQSEWICGIWMLHSGATWCCPMTHVTASQDPLSDDLDFAERLVQFCQSISMPQLLTPKPAAGFPLNTGDDNVERTIKHCSIFVLKGAKIHHKGPWTKRLHPKQNASNQPPEILDPFAL